MDPRLFGGLLTSQKYLDTVKTCEGVAITKAYAEAGKADAQSLVSIGELGETLSFLMSPLRKVSSLSKRVNTLMDILENDRKVYDARRRKYDQLPEHLRLRRDPPKLVKRQWKIGKVQVSDVASLWLAYRYGLMPLVYDVQDHWKAFQNLAEKPPERQTARGKWKELFVEDDPDLVEGDAAMGSSWRTTRSTQYEVTSRAGVLYEPKVEVDIPQRFGLELHRLPSALWEWTPLSFVADWLLNMGNFIDAMSAHLRTKAVLGAWVTTTVTYLHQSRFRFTPTYGGAIGVGSYTQTCRFKSRRPVTLADIRLEYRLDMNVKRVADAFALGYQFLTKLVKRK